MTSFDYIAPALTFAYNVLMDEEQHGKASGQMKFYMPVQSRKQIVWNNFLGGIAWSAGTLVGLALLVAVAGFILQKIDFNAILGEWIGDIIKQAFSQIQPPDYSN